MNQSEKQNQDKKPTWRLMHNGLKCGTPKKRKEMEGRGAAQMDRQMIHIGQNLFYLTEEELAAFKKILKEHPEYKENDQLLLQALAMVKNPQETQSTSQP